MSHNSANPPNLPSPHTKRWVARRKAEIVNAVRNGKMNIEDACRYYMLSTEEFAAWERAIEAHGGRIWFEPNPGGGVSFHFQLPLSAQSAEAHVH